MSHYILGLFNPKKVRNKLLFFLLRYLYRMRLWCWKHELFHAFERSVWRFSCRHKFRGRTANQSLLTRQQKKEISDYFAPYFRVRHEDCQFYTEKTGHFDVRYMPDAMYYTSIDRYYNDWRLADKLDNKCILHKLLPNAPVWRHLCCRMGNLWLDAKGEVISYDAAYQIVCKQKEVVIKLACESYGGHGVTFFSPALCSEDDFKRILATSSGDLVIQPVLKQSAELARLNPTSVNTVRFISLLSVDGSVKIYSAILRMGIGLARVDNASSGGITCGILPDGRLKNIAYSASGVRYEEVHPSTEVRFSDIVIPNYDKAKQVVIDNHHELPHSRLLSWDIAFDENDEPALIEVNMCFGELDFHKLNNGPLFGEDTEKILKEVFCSVH